MTSDTNLQTYFKRLFNGKSKERSQMTIIGTEDGRLRKIELDALLACIVDEETHLAFLQQAGNQLQNKADGRWYQIVGERSTIPLTFRGTTTDPQLLEGIISGIYERSQEQAKAKKYQESKENKNWSRFVWLTSLVVVAAIVIAVIRVI